MTRKQRGVAIGLVIVGTLGGAELALQSWKGSRACVEIQNQGAEPIESLAFTLRAARTAVGRVESGATVKVWLSGEGPQTLQVDFRQKGNGLTGWQLPGFDPKGMARDGSRLIIQVRPNEIIRYQDEAEPSTPFGRYARRSWDSFWKSLETSL
jgi:hypothetical protein